MFLEVQLLKSEVGVLRGVPLVATGLSEGGTAMVYWVRQVACGLHGHDQMLQFAKDRMFLKCSTCGYESPGWELTEPQPIVTAAGDRGRHALTQPIVEMRRVA
jgi:hypothetical protein